MQKFSGVRRNDLSWQPRPLAALGAGSLRAAVVGGTGGIGRAIARRLADHGASVVVVGQTFRDEGRAGLSFVRADLSSMAEARRVGRELPAEELDLVVFTNGIMAAPTREQTAEGLERDMAVSYLSRLAIVREAGPRLAERARRAPRRPRVFVMGFPGTGAEAALDDLNAETSYDAMRVHMTTVAGNEALVLDGARRHPGVGFYGLNPGLIATDIRSNYMGRGSLRYRAAEWLIGKLTPSADQYAARVAPLLLAPELDAHSGAMFNAKAQAIRASASLTDDAVRRLIDASEALVARAAPLRA